MLVDFSNQNLFCYATTLWLIHDSTLVMFLLSHLLPIYPVQIRCKAQKSLAFLYTNNEKLEREIKESIPFSITTKRIKYLGINLPKSTKELYRENNKKEIKDDINSCT